MGIRKIRHPTAAVGDGQEQRLLMESRVFVERVRAPAPYLIVIPAPPDDNGPDRLMKAVIREARYLDRHPLEFLLRNGNETA